MIDLRLGDGVAGLAELGPGAVDVTITDPPFDGRTHRAAGARGDWRTGKRRRVALPFPPLTRERLAEVAGHLARVTRRWILVFSAERQVEAWAAGLEAGGARFVRLGVALRNNPAPQRTGDRPAPAADQLVIAHGGGEGMHWNGGGGPAVWTARAARWDTGRRNVHPAQKPLDLMRALVEAFSDPGELVLDPFAGSGTTALACRQTGRRFLGWEIESGYHEVAMQRLEGTATAPAGQLGLGLGRSA